MDSLNNIAKSSGRTWKHILKTHIDHQRWVEILPTERTKNDEIVIFQSTNSIQFVLDANILWNMPYPVRGTVKPLI